MRLAVVCVLALAGLAGCGSDPAPQRALPGVRLTLDGPADASVTQGETATVTGTVSPVSAEVLVAGSQATVTDGRFTASVPLQGGANIIDVEAAAPRRPAAMTAVRVTRQIPVEVPDVGGESPAAAEARLRAAGFKVDVKRGGGLFDEIIPGTLGACGTEPSAGERVLPGKTVTLEVRKSC